MPPVFSLSTTCTLNCRPQHIASHAFRQRRSEEESLSVYIEPLWSPSNGEEGAGTLRADKLSPAGGGNQGRVRTGQERRWRRRRWGRRRRLSERLSYLCRSFYAPLHPVCRFMLSKAFAWTELPSRAAGAQEPSAVGHRQAGRGSCFHLDTKTHTGTRPYALSSSD